MISAETIPIQLYGGKQHGNHEVTYTRKNGNKMCITWVYILRLYLDGEYPDPSASQPQRLPEDDTCIVL